MNSSIFTLEQARKSLVILGVPVNREHLRKCARAKYLLDNGHLRFVRNEEDWRIYHVASQWCGTEWDGGLYTVRLNGTHHDCDCPDSAKSDICKHRIACKMYEFKQSHNGNGRKSQEMVTFTADHISGYESRYLSVWMGNRMYSVSATECQIEGNMVTMPKVIADRLGINTTFDPERPEYSDDDKFDEKIFHEAISQWKEALLTSMYQ